MKPVDKMTRIPVKFASIAQYEQYIRQLRHPNTHFALEAYSNFMANQWPLVYRSIEDNVANITEGERLGQLVGRAYGYDTKHINSPETCEGCVRPGMWLYRMIGLL